MTGKINRPGAANAGMLLCLNRLKIKISCPPTSLFSDAQDDKQVINFMWPNENFIKCVLTLL